MAPSVVSSSMAKQMDSAARAELKDREALVGKTIPADVADTISYLDIRPGRGDFRGSFGSIGQCRFNEKESPKKMPIMGASNMGVMRYLSLPCS